MSPFLLTTRQDPDSDSDFNPGSFVPETKKRGRRSGDSRKAGEPPSKRRRRATLEDVDGSSRGSRARSRGKLGDPIVVQDMVSYFSRLDGVKTGDAVPLQRNLLAQYFGG